MEDKFSRREWMEALALAGATPAIASSVQSGASAPEILPLTCNSGVFIPPRGQSYLKFSFDFPEPSVAFDGLQFSFRIYTLENTYALDGSQLHAENTVDGIVIRCSQLIWAGGQQKAPGRVIARVRKNSSSVEWDAEVEAPHPIKCVSAIVRGIPRGQLAAGGSRFFDPHDSEVLFGYPFGGGALFQGASAMQTPLLAIDSGNNKFAGISVADDRVHAERFYLQPGESGYRVELISEPHGWERSKSWKTPVWRITRGSTAEEVSAPHYQHVQQAFHLVDWQSRTDVPEWFQKVSLVVALHGMHWTGYIFNDFAKMRKTLDWVATQISGERVMVFLPAWDGRYYWNYPIYKADDRLGGEAGLRDLVKAGHARGIHFVAMYGTNTANVDLRMFPQISAGGSTTVDGAPFRLNWVDWDNDRQYENSYEYMNLGVSAWRNWLEGRIADTITRYGMDGYFLDIVGGWVNNTTGDMHQGTRELVADLRAKYPKVLAIGEMSYDALYGVIPVYQVGAGPFSKYCRVFRHLSNPAPGRGSSGVHESGFGHFNIEAETHGTALPTITVVDDTFEQHKEEMLQIIAAAKQRS